MFLLSGKSCKTCFPCSYKSKSSPPGFSSRFHATFPPSTSSNTREPRIIRPRPSFNTPRPAFTTPHTATPRPRSPRPREYQFPDERRGSGEGPEVDMGFAMPPPPPGIPAYGPPTYGPPPGMLPPEFILPPGGGPVNNGWFRGMGPRLSPPYGRCACPPSSESST